MQQQQTTVHVGHDDSTGRSDEPRGRAGTVFRDRALRRRQRRRRSATTILKRGRGRRKRTEKGSRDGGHGARTYAPRHGGGEGDRRWKIATKTDGEKYNKPPDGRRPNARAQRDGRTHTHTHGGRATSVTDSITTNTTATTRSRDRSRSRRTLSPDRRVRGDWPPSESFRNKRFH